MGEAEFPAGFRWGAATSAYQIEGAVRADGRGESIWDRFVRTPSAIHAGSTGDVACDHYHRTADDIATMRELGIDLYRFSIAWPRVLPNGWGKPNKAGLDFYDRLVDQLLAQGIEPSPNLYHWDLPVRLQDAGGWLGRDAVLAFQEYADIVSRRLGDRVHHWMTINEPWVHAVIGHALGVHAPGGRRWASVAAVGHHLLLAHGLALGAIRSNVDTAKIGIGLPLSPVYAASDHERDLEASIREDGLRNRFWLDPLIGKGYPSDIVELFGDEWPEMESGDMDAIASPVDYIGVNYYGPVFVLDDPQSPVMRVKWTINPELPATASGQMVDPPSLTALLLRLRDDYESLSITITENGAAFPDQPPEDGEVRDPQRTRFLHAHLEAVLDAIEQGVSIDGYVVWSLMDNFEWAEGYTKRFGLVHVDFETQRRTMKASGRWYSRVIERNALVDPT